MQIKVIISRLYCAHFPELIRLSCTWVGISHSCNSCHADNYFSRPACVFVYMFNMISNSVAPFLRVHMHEHMLCSAQLTNNGPLPVSNTKIRGQPIIIWDIKHLQE